MANIDTKISAPAGQNDDNAADAIDLVVKEMECIKHLPNAAEIASIEGKNSLNDRIAISIAYLGRASEKVQRNEREGCGSIENLTKAAAVICAAINAEISKTQL